MINNLYANEPMKVGQMVTVKFGTLTIVGTVKEINGGNFYINDVRNGDQFKGMFGFNEYDIVPTDLEPFFKMSASHFDKLTSRDVTCSDSFEITDNILEQDEYAVVIECDSDRVVRDGEQVIGAYIEYRDGTFTVTEQMVLFENANYCDDDEIPEIRDYMDGRTWSYKTLRGVSTAVNNILDRVQIDTVQQ